MEFNKTEYDKEYRKKHKAQFSVDLNKDEKEELDVILKQHKLQKVQFVRGAIKNLKKEIEMKKYYIYCGTNSYKNLSGKWTYECETSLNKNDRYIGIYEDYDEAIKIYSSIELEKNEGRGSMYTDYKQLYEFDTDTFTEEEIEDNELDMEKMKLLEEECADNN